MAAELNVHHTGGRDHRAHGSPRWPGSSAARCRPLRRSARSARRERPVPRRSRLGAPRTPVPVCDPRDSTRGPCHPQIRCTARRPSGRRRTLYTAPPGAVMTDRPSDVAVACRSTWSASSVGATFIAFNASVRLNAGSTFRAEFASAASWPESARFRCSYATTAMPAITASAVTSPTNAVVIRRRRRAASTGPARYRRRGSRAPASSAGRLAGPPRHCFGQRHTPVQGVPAAVEPLPLLGRQREAAVDEQAGAVFVDPLAQLLQPVMTASWEISIQRSPVASSAVIVSSRASTKRRITSATALPRRADAR